MTENPELRRLYETMERNVLILIAIPIPFFGFVYLNSENPVIVFDFPNFAPFWNYLGLAITYAVLIFQYFYHQKNLKVLRAQDIDLNEKFAAYSKAIIKRFGILFLVVVLTSLGLLIFGNAGYTIAFAIALFFLSFAKPNPDRIIDSLKLKGEDKEHIEKLKKRLG